MLKSLTVRQISLLISCLVVLISIGLLSIFMPLGIGDFPVLKTFLAIIVCIFFTYLLISFILEKYVNRRIKLIYKIIHDHKLSALEKKKDAKFNVKNIDEVKEEVEQWVESTNQELMTLKSLEEYRKSFLGNISHELKTPIFSIQGYLHTLLEGGLADKKINIKYLERAITNAERLQTIAEDLEIINRLESGMEILESQVFDIKVLSNEVMNDLQFKAKEGQVKLSFKEGASENIKVYADRDSIRQVLSNLMINAIKYGRKNGWVKVGIYDMENIALVEISDNGIGIPEKHSKHVFDRFYRVDPSRSRKMGGSGLGLAIVKHIIEAHNETINVRSTPDIGSTFGFSLKKAK